MNYIGKRIRCYSDGDNSRVESEDETENNKVEDISENRTTSLVNSDNETNSNRSIRTNTENDNRAPNTFFWRAHRITVLILLISVLFYVALIEPTSTDSTNNCRRGIIACGILLLIFGITQTPDGLFVRPHPVVWKTVLTISLLYEMILVYLIFQNVNDARKLLKHIDPKLGVPLEERDYGGNCMFYDPNNTANPFHNFIDKVDEFVPVHFFGWWLKTLILRDYWLCWVLSIMFEVMEYTLEHQLPNFSECWWDHVFLDVLICNNLGIYLGMKTCLYFEMKKYDWRNLWAIDSYKDKLGRMATQFAPRSWQKFAWRPFSSVKRWLAMLFVISMFLLAELGTFYLKFILWVPPPHNLCGARLIFLLLAGGVSMREVYEYLDNDKCKKFGSQAWIMAVIIVTEILIVVKFDKQTILKPLPDNILKPFFISTSNKVKGE
ncbi:hypothetical protein SNEBB_005613 [Seison nebaliae]|nr:hypothetical protein SNEBB_005613 [Seison nebaliae]